MENNGREIQIEKEKQKGREWDRDRYKEGESGGKRENKLCQNVAWKMRL